MSYIQREKEQLGNNFLQYISIIENQIFAKLKSQLNDKIVIRNQEYKLLKWERTVSLDIGINDIKIHSLFSPDGCNLSGSIILEVRAEMPGSKGNLSKNYQFTVNFESAPVRFDFTSETFELLDDIGITYITE